MQPEDESSPNQRPLRDAKLRIPSEQVVAARHGPGAVLRCLVQGFKAEGYLRRLGESRQALGIVGNIGELPIYPSWSPSLEDSMRGSHLLSEVPVTNYDLSRSKIHKPLFVSKALTIP